MQVSSLKALVAEASRGAVAEARDLTCTCGCMRTSRAARDAKRTHSRCWTCRAESKCVAAHAGQHRRRARDAHGVGALTPAALLARNGSWDAAARLLAQMPATQASPVGTVAILTHFVSPASRHTRAARRRSLKWCAASKTFAMLACHPDPKLVYSALQVIDEPSYCDQVKHPAQ
eukprot:3544024-Pleurochrysis_carterae.AAC.3